MMKRTSVKIDIDNWARKTPYLLFRSIQSPHFNMTSDIDVSKLIEHDKPLGVSIFNAVLFSIMKAVNQIPEMKCRFSGDEVYQYELSDASFTIPLHETEFAFCEAEYSENWTEFNQSCIAAVTKAKNQTELLENTVSDHWTYLSCVPWFHFTSVTHPHDGPQDCIPRIAWGKFTRRENKWYMPFNLQAHHALMDGYHTGLFFKLVQQHLNEEDFAR